MRAWASRVLIPGVFVLLVSALIIALWVIPAVRADASPQAMPGRAVPPLWAAVLITTLMAGTGLVALGGRAAPTRLRRVAGAIAGAVAALLGLALVDAAAAFAGHEPPLRGAVVGLWVCVVCNLLGGAALLVAAARSRGRPAGPGVTAPTTGGG